MRVQPGYDRPSRAPLERQREKMFRTIVVGTDGSDTAGEAVRQAVDLARAVGAGLGLVSAYEPVPTPRAPREPRADPAEPRGRSRRARKSS